MNGNTGRRDMVISRRWMQGGILTFIVGFVLLGLLGATIYRGEPPIPGRVVDPAGQAVFTRDDVLAGQGVFEKYALMEHGTILGHGALLGPDFTAEYLHLQAQEMIKTSDQHNPATRDAVASVLHDNKYDPASDTLAFTAGQTAAFATLVEFYSARFNSPSGQDIVPAHYIQDPTELRQLTAFFAWTAWTATANRPGESYSYTSNWPPDVLAGNSPTAEAVVWSVISMIALLGGSGLLLLLFGRYN